jgi:hypothetical protein
MSANQGDDAERAAILAELWPETDPEPDCLPGENEYDAKELADLVQALILLGGYQDRSRRRPEKKYLELGEEYIGRKAIARLLRSNKPVDQTILLRLAALFDPDPEAPPFIELSAIERRLEFVPRNANRPITAEISRLELARAFKTALAAKGRVPKARDDTLNEIADEYAVSTRSIEAALAYYKSVVGR